jgi:hypothetical protein
MLGIDSWAPERVYKFGLCSWLGIELTGDEEMDLGE